MARIPPQYTSDDLRVLDDLDHVRRWPDMYVGHTDERGVHFLLLELAGDGLFEAVNGHATEITVRLHADGAVTVADDGRPLADPVTPFLRFRLGGFERPTDPAAPRRACSIYYFVANALSESLRVEVRGGGACRRIDFSRGTLVGEQTTETATGTGLSVTLRPDRQTFRYAGLDADRLRSQLFDWACQHPDVRFTLADERLRQTDSYRFAEGMPLLVRQLIRAHGTEPEHLEVPSFRGRYSDCLVAAAFQLAHVDCGLRSFAAGRETFSGGPHAVGFLRVVARELARAARQRHLPRTGLRPSGLALRGGFAGSVAVWLRGPVYGGATRHRLCNPEARAAVERVVGPQLRDWLAENRHVVTAAVRRAVAARRNSRPAIRRGDR